MARSDWKGRIGRLPVLGNVFTGLRGVWSLSAWRAQLRQQIDALSERSQTLEMRLAQAQAGTERAEMASQALEARLVQLEQAVALLEPGLQRERAADAARLEERLARVADLQARYAQTLYAHERRLRATSAELRQGLTQMRRVAARQAFAQADLPAPVPAPALAPACRLAAQALDAFLGPEAEPQLAPFQHLLAAQAGVGEPRGVLLPAGFASDWAQGLGAFTAGSLAAVVAPAGAGALQRAELDALLDAAAQALRPDGLLVLAYANPENAVVAGRLVVEAAGAPIWTPPLMERCVRDAGYGEVSVLRYAADADDGLPAEAGAGFERLERWLFGPRRFAVHGRRAGGG
ncbi:hypothetical protein FOZ76_26235 [Verticiella sediminum]|uniref:Uncharacterized protein n=1 Tax=Verticiella sediminum TaxID=1247510 RepID=A0A556A8A4_9BURK|nr:hypothetical protein [Verticiella sediminum]TSH89110.1 hypothetical protein FOZ76_26235 [Verticiella sediminum]